MNLTGICKQLLLFLIYFPYAVIYRKNANFDFRNKKIAIFMIGKDSKNRPLSPLGEFIIREPFYKYLIKKNNKLVLITINKDYAELKPFRSYFDQVLTLEEFLNSKVNYDYIMLLQNYMGLPFEDLHKKAKYVFSYAHQGLLKNPKIWKYIDYMPTYLIGDRHELQRTFDIIKEKIDLENPFNLPKVLVNKPIKTRICINLLDEENFKSISSQNIAEVVSYLGNRFPKFEFVFIGPTDAIKTSRTIQKSLSDLKIINLTGKTSVKKLSEIISSSQLIITPDTGTAHLSAALNRPTLVYYLSTTLKRWKPLGKFAFQLKIHSRPSESIISAIEDIMLKIKRNELY